jgi:hypothetical protein
VPCTRFDEITGKNGTQTDDGELRGLHLRKPGKTLSQTDMTTKIDELFATLRGLLADQSRDLALAMAELRSVEAERDNARQSLRAAEQDVAETESVNSDLRTVNARLVADLAAAMERLDHAESILMQ